MKPPFRITARVLEQVAVIERLLGRLESLDQPKPQPALRKSNRIRTVQGSLAIEGNTLDLDQVTALLEGKTVLGKPDEIQEVRNAIELYDRMDDFEPLSSRSMLRAHRILLQKLDASAGTWRTGNVGILTGTEVSHVAPPPHKVPELMKSLFQFLKEDESHALIKSAVFHYELEFIHPFDDGNGRLGRFWHSLLLTHYHPVFEYTPVESLIRANQKAYYAALGGSDNAGDSTEFIEFSLDMVRQALEELVNAIRPGPSTTQTRLEGAKAHFGDEPFSRKHYMRLHKGISSATASRDLRSGVEAGMLLKEGDRAATVYRFRV